MLTSSHGARAGGSGQSERRRREASDGRVPIQDLIHPNGQDNALRISRFNEHGREYYAVDNKLIYPFPCDEMEANRLDIFHSLLHDQNGALDGKLHKAELRPRNYRRQCLDVGFGTGIWAYEMAKSNPDMEVIGIDLISNQPSRDEYIPNVSFQAPVDFTRVDWPFALASFDFIRELSQAQMMRERKNLNELRHLRPGTGFVEHIEIDWNVQCRGDHGLSQQALSLKHWWERMQLALSKLGRPNAYPKLSGGMLTDAGLIDFNHKVVQIPLRPGCQTDEQEFNLNGWYRAGMDLDCQGFAGLCMSLFTRQLGESPEYVRSLCNELRSISASRHLDLYYDIHIWTARKPFN